MSNKDLVARFVEAMRMSDVDALETMFTDDFTWWIAGKPDYLQTVGDHDKAFFLGFFGSGNEMFPDGVAFDVSGMVAESNKVAVEAHLTARTATGSKITTTSITSITSCSKWPMDGSGA